ncbi:HypC/HybG/HupF family hydrogenase formation chaperone [Calditerrivibrio nitroreducens]|uniref:Hydrogenase assembly chaperone hypC/hupF n=1 Tax=Calditerrivibrio nitroreducens (strain DSM 19672 / NBRC 101217 / Yu37-1) TaxID=768670 RepID=E4TEM0_CALNY|nr:HypC/HybG/HupF family hydrogenase formation chaperone [Calditerrivibrio nitroreducens]ADR19377.1 hydrogenase assembly chaperone hypC/hupF [Calditerrivibrio nitroreducens DSM 19672]
MCLGFPGKIIEMDEAMAIVDIAGTKREVSLAMLPDDVNVGDYVMVHVGFAIAKMDEKEAEETLKVLLEYANELDEQVS